MVQTNLVMLLVLVVVEKRKYKINVTYGNYFSSKHYQKYTDKTSPSFIAPSAANWKE